MFSTETFCNNLAMSDAPRSLLWGAFRIVTSVLLLSAVFAQAASTFSHAVANDRDVVTTVTNFFSYFTVLSNVSAAVVFALAGIWMIRTRRLSTPLPRGLSIALACVSTYMIVTGVVFNLLLRGYALQAATVAWSNEVLHLIGPALILVDALCAARRQRLPWTTVLAALCFPLAWVVYTLLRAPLVTNPVTADPWWYPYPFLNPHTASGGWLEVTAYIVGIAVFITAAAFFVVAATRWNTRPTATQPSLSS